MSSAPERSSEHPAFLPASCTDSQTQQHPCGQELGCSVHFCLLSKPCELPDSLERSLQSHFHTSSASGHGRYEPLPMCAASTGEQGKARTRTSSPENSSGESPVRAASMGSGSCRLCTLVASQQRFLRCSASAKSHGSLLVCSDSCGRAVARQHTQAHLNPVRGACSALQACCSSTSTPQPRTQRRANEVTDQLPARRQARGAAGELQGEEERNWTHGCSLLLDFSPK